MTKQKIFFSFCALLIGTLVVLGIFYVYEKTQKVKPSQVERINILSPTPANSSTNFLILGTPKDQSVTNQRIVTISGKTTPNAELAILTQTSQIGAQAASDGSFSTNITLDKGVNIIEVDVVASNGETTKAKRTITYSTQDF